MTATLSRPGLGIEVRLLTGRFVATCYYDRRQSEWPPHPARLFSALVAAYADADVPSPQEREALEWLESQPSPAISASTAVPRIVASHFVPVNDVSIFSSSWYVRKAAKVAEYEDQLRHADRARSGNVRELTKLQKKLERERDVESQATRVGNTNSEKARKLLPEWRKKQERHFPSVTPESPLITYTWDKQCPKHIADTLDQLLHRVTRLGHSSSLVSCRCVFNAPAPTYVPGENGQMIRGVESGQLRELERNYKLHQGVKPRSLPFNTVAYSKKQPDSGKSRSHKSNLSGYWQIFEFQHGSRSYPITSTQVVARSMRQALLSHAEDPIPEGLSGHQRAGGPSVKPHIGFHPLPFVAHEHADGRLMGIAVSIPDALDDSEKQAIYRAIGLWERSVSDGSLKLTMGRQGVIRMKRLQGLPLLSTLKYHSWKAKSSCWVTVTPIALPRHPGSLTRGSTQARARAWAKAAEVVRKTVTHAGLPEAGHVEVMLNPLVGGSHPVAKYPAFHQRTRDGAPLRRQLVHAAIYFDSPVEGPLVLGAGRFVGLGLMRPVRK